SSQVAAAGHSPVATVGCTQATPLPADRSSMGVATGADGLIYSVGGLQNVPVATVQAYDTSAGTWSGVPSLPTTRHSLAAATGGDDRLYAIGGQHASTILSSVVALDPSAGGWVSVTSLTTARRALAATTGSD